MYTVTSFTYKTAGFEIPTLAYQYSLLSNGVVYTLTCRSDPGAEMADTFSILFSGFVLAPLPAQ
jgi:hypothetical protein